MNFRFSAILIFLSCCGLGISSFALPEPLIPEAGKTIDRWSMIGPFSIDQDETSTATTPGRAGIPELEAAQQIAPEKLIWQEDEPFRWFDVAANPDGWLEVQQQFSKAREGNLVYLRRSLSIKRDSQMVLALGSNGPLKVWIDGRPLPSFAQGIWSPPGDDRWLEVVTLEKGMHQIMIRSEQPRAALMWMVRARFISAESFTQGSVIYPRWQTSVAPPWTGKEPVLWARWGDPAIQQFLEIGPTTGSVEVVRYADPAGAAVYKVGMGQSMNLLPFVRREGSTLVSLRAELPNLRQGMLGDHLSLLKASSFLSVVLGSPEGIPLNIEETKSRAKSLQDSEDGKAISYAFNSPALTEDDSQGIRLGILRRTQEYLSQEKSRDKGESCPTGWMYLSFSPEKNPEIRMPYTVQMPAGLKYGDTAQLILALAPLETDPFHIALRESSFAAVSEGKKWILASLNIDVPLRGMETDEQVLDALCKDLEKRFKLSFSRIALMGFFDAAPLTLVQALLHPNLYSGAAILDGRWAGIGVWDGLFLNHCPRPALYFAGTILSAFYPVDSLAAPLEEDDGAWLKRTMTADNHYQIANDMFRFLEDKMMDGQPGRLTVSGNSRPLGQPRWLVVRQALDVAQPANLTATIKSTNTLTIQPRNVSQFDMLLKDLPGLMNGKPLLLEIENQSLRVISRELPEALRLRLVEDKDRPTHWEAAQITAAAVEQRILEEQEIAETDFDVSALPDGESSSIARLFAAATRKAAGAQVALVWAESVESGQGKGKITRSDVEGWSRDSKIATTTLSASFLIETLARDYAGSRFYVTDGLDAIVHSPSMEALNGTDGPTTGTPIPIATPVPAAAIADPLRMFRSTALDAAGPTVVVAGWKPLLDELVKGQAAREKNTVSAVHNAPFMQTEAVIRMLTEQKKFPELGPDIRGMERKKAEEMKKVLSINP